MHKIRLWFNITSFYSSLFQFVPFRDEIIFSSNTGYTIVTRQWRSAYWKHE